MLSNGLMYISSDDSEDSEVCLYTRPLPWLKSKYEKSLHQLDELWYDGLSAKSKQMTCTRLRGSPSDRDEPSGAPDYLVKPRVNDEDNAHIMNSSMET